MVEPRDLCISRIWEEFCIMETTVNQGSGEQGLSQALGPSSFGFFQKTRGFLPLWKHKTGVGVGLVLWDSPQLSISDGLPTRAQSTYLLFSSSFWFLFSFLLYIGVWLGASQVILGVKNPPIMQKMQETWVQSLVQSLGQEDPLQEGLATHSSILAWRIQWTEEPGGL